MSEFTLSHSFQMEHSPRGAEASFNMGLVGVGGGFSLEDGVVPEQDVYIGYHQDGRVTMLPYCQAGGEANDTGMADFVPTGQSEDGGPFRNIAVRFLDDAAISRTFRFATDSFQADRISLSLATPVDGIPHPDAAPASIVKDAVAPAIIGQLTFDNTDGDSGMTGFFAVGGLDNFCFLEDETGGELMGIQCLAGYGFGTAVQEGVRTFSDFTVVEAFRRRQPLRTRHQGLGGLLIDVPPGQARTVTIAFAWYKPGIVTLGRACSYFYTHYFATLPEVVSYALERANIWAAKAIADDEMLENSGLNEYRRFLLAKSIRSYYGSTQLFAEGNRWRWVANEGSCNMINTLDLTVDMAFYEAQYHPWLLRNVLDTFADEYSYVDRVHSPEKPDVALSGGISFTHDQGVRNVFTPNSYSHYELADHPGCFSYMTHEELLNWVLCASIYVKASNDPGWLHRRAGMIADCLHSMQNRDNPDPAQRDGLMSFDSDRCGLESEITTYDSLDPSLGQARRNAYMGVKGWAGYLAVAYLLEQENPDRWKQQITSARASAALAADTVTAAFDEKLGYIPAILDGKDTSAIIPVIEGLVYPQQLDLDEAIAFDGPFGHLLNALKRHLEAVLVPGVCLFENSGWKLSGNNENSWMSKIFICQHVAETVLGCDFGEQQVAFDRAHDHWWRVGCRAHSVVDQVIAGATPGRGSIYPRCVSAFLWLS